MKTYNEDEQLFVIAEKRFENLDLNESCTLKELIEEENFNIEEIIELKQEIEFE